GSYSILQIADYDVDCITPFSTRQRQRVDQGQRFSQIRYGSQVDLVVPLSDRYQLLPVQSTGDHVEAGVDPIIEIREELPAPPPPRAAPPDGQPPAPPPPPRPPPPRRSAHPPAFLPPLFPPHPAVLVFDRGREQRVDGGADRRPAPAGHAAVDDPVHGGVSLPRRGRARLPAPDAEERPPAGPGVHGEPGRGHGARAGPEHGGDLELHVAAAAGRDGAGP